MGCIQQQFNSRFEELIGSMQSSSQFLIPAVGRAPDRALRPKPKRSRNKVAKENCNHSNPAGRRTSVYRGVTRHRWTGRYEAHLWDKTCWNQTQSKKGRQVYLGAYDDEEAAAHAYDLAALKYWGPETILNFPSSTYANEIKEMQRLSKEEYLAALRRRSSGFSRGVSKYRGVARHHNNGRWEARIGRVFGNKYLYLGTYNTQEEAAAAYDLAAIEHRGLNAVTNFDMSHYIQGLHPPGQKEASNDQDSDNISYRKRDFISTNNMQNGRICHDDDNVMLQDDQFIIPTASNNISDCEYSCQLLQPRINRSSDHSTALGLLLQSTKFKEMLQKSTDLINSGDQQSASTSCSDTVDADRRENVNNESINHNFSEEMDALFESSDNIFGQISNHDCLSVNGNPTGYMNTTFQCVQSYDDQMQHFNQMQLGLQMWNGDCMELHNLHQHEDPLIYHCLQI